MWKHTPGPWFPVEDSVMTDGANYLGRFVAKFVTGKDESEKTANALLISAAPDLLEACKAMVACYEFEHVATEHDSIYGQAVSAIAKAEGGK